MTEKNINLAQLMSLDIQTQNTKKRDKPCQLHDMIYQSLSFDDVLLRPNTSNISSRSEVALGVELSAEPSVRSLKLCNPLIASPMDTVCEERMAIHMALNGGLGIIHRFMDQEEQVRQVLAVKRYVNYIFRDPYTVAEIDVVGEINNKSGETGVWTYCVVSKVDALGAAVCSSSGFGGRQEYVFHGLITRRDLEGASDDKTVAEIMTPVNECYCLRVNKCQFNGREVAAWDVTSDRFRRLMVAANDLMTSQRVQKVPVLSDDGRNILIGMITRRSVKYYFQNMEKSSLDSLGRLRVGAAVGIKTGYLDQVRKLVDAGVDLVCVDVANGHNTHTLAAVESIRKQFAALVIMAGNVCTGEGAVLLARAGADCIRVGIGNGSICSTRLETGVGFGQWSSVRECFQALSREQSSARLICDGGSLGKSGNKFKALAAGSSAVMLGRTLASCDESPGQVITRNGKRMKYFRGMASTMANLSNQERATKRAKLETKFTAEGVDGVIELKGSVADLLDQINGALRSGMSYLGARSMDELHQLARSGAIHWSQQTSIGMSETGIRVATL